MQKFAFCKSSMFLSFVWFLWQTVTTAINTAVCHPSDTTSEPITGLINKNLFARDDAWMQTSQSDHVYISPTALPILVCTNVVLFSLYFTIYQRHWCIITIYIWTCVTCTPWRWPQKLVETCRGYLYIWTSEISWKQTELFMCIAQRCTILNLYNTKNPYTTLTL
jgi:hypothetical protein